MIEKNLASFNEENLLPLISASAVLRKEKICRNLIKTAQKKNISYRKIYEALLQTYLFAGFPSALNSLKILREFYQQKYIYNEKRSVKKPIVIQRF